MNSRLLGLSALALVASEQPAPQAQEKTLAVPSDARPRYLKISTVEDTEYHDEGGITQ